MTKRVDVLVIGAGPAGATAALNLAPYRTVLVADMAPEPLRRVGESLSPAARRMLMDMGLFDAFGKLGMLPWYANSSVWGTETSAETDFLGDPDECGWHIDRVAFEEFLRSAARQRGAELLAPATVESIIRDGDSFRVKLRTRSSFVLVKARFLIDAGGRSAPVGRRLGARRVSDLPLLCAGIYGRARHGHQRTGLTFTEAVSDGWWYTAPLPGYRRVLGFHTDSDNPAAQRARTRDGLLAQLEQTVGLWRLLNAAGFEAEDQHFLCVAGGSALDPCAGEGWLASGDAALTFDPLSSQGLLNALFLGLAAAETAHSTLSGESSAVPEYISAVAEIRAAYCRGLDRVYARVRRWPDSPFWQRRSAG